MATFNTNAGDVRLIGGRICLDFVNTVDSHLKAQPKEYLVDYAALLIWAQHASMISAAVAADLGGAAAQRPQSAEAILQQARELRGALYTLYAGIARPDAMPQPGRAADALAIVNALLAAAPPRTQIGQRGGDLSWVSDQPSDPLAMPLWRVLWSAAELLTSAERAQIGQCQGDGCSWLFLDTSPNHSRRWCSMEDCGNRAKARRHYDRSTQGKKKTRD